MKQIKISKTIRISKTRLKAHWIDITDATTDDGGYDWHVRDKKCSNCGKVVGCYYNPNYCDVCGARMVKK